MRRIVRSLAAAFCLAAAPGAAGACGVELVLAVDVSRSVINPEFNLQLNGLAQAFRDPEVVESIGWIQGGVAATLMQWSGPRSQSQSVDWRLLSDRGSALAFADEIAGTRRKFFAAFTAVGEALFQANILSASNPWQCQRRVIDVSGDGASNRGRAAAPVAAGLAANGVTINALVIRGAKPDPVAYYAENVIAGQGAFIETAASFDDYAEAMKTKLLRELRPAMALK